MMRLVMRVIAAQVISDSECLDEPFVVAGVSAGVHDPGVGAFHDPAPGQDDEPGGVLRAADGLDRQVQMGLRPGHELSGIGGIRPDDGDLRVHQPQSEEDLLGRVAVGHSCVGEVGDHVERGLHGVELGVQVLDPPALGLQSSVRGDGAGDEAADLGESAADDRDLVCLEPVGCRRTSGRPQLGTDERPQFGGSGRGRAKMRWWGLLGLLSVGGA